MKIFICHASEDKDEIARPLADALVLEGYDVWYDDFVLHLGDSLSQKIDEGLAECDYGIVLLSPAFFQKQWPQRELAGLVQREMSNNKEKNIILPIWHNIDKDDVAQFSPPLADRIAVSTSNGVVGIVNEINATTEFLTQDTRRIEPAEKIRSASFIIENLDLKPVDDGIGDYLTKKGYISQEGVNTLKEFVNQWNKFGYLLFTVILNDISREHKIAILHEDKAVLLRLEQCMFQMYAEVLDLATEPIGSLWTPPNKTDNEYNRAIAYFLHEMGFYDGQLATCHIVTKLIRDNRLNVAISDGHELPLL